MRLVILESPYAGDIEKNVTYARQAVRDSLSHGEAPIASHLLYTQPGILRDEDATERQWGIDAGLAWAAKAEATVVYTDFGISNGMNYGIENAMKAGRPIEYRTMQALKMVESQFKYGKCWQCRGDGHYWRVRDGFNPFLAGAMQTARVSEKVRCFRCEGTGRAIVLDEGEQ